MSAWFKTYTLAVVACAAAAAGAALATLVLVSHYQARIATLERDQARAMADARAADVETLQLAKRRGDALTLQLQATESSLTHKEKELHDAIRRQTTGRACLSGDVVRLLNQAATEGRAAHLPAPTASPVAADEPAATDTGYTSDFASDRDIAEWAANARTQYDICRARLNALIDW